MAEELQSVQIGVPAALSFVTRMPHVLAVDFNQRISTEWRSEVGPADLFPESGDQDLVQVMDDCNEP
jgi:hypothetical protein